MLIDHTNDKTASRDARATKREARQTRFRARYGEKWGFGRFQLKRFLCSVAFMGLAFHGVGLFLIHFLLLDHSLDTALIHGIVGGIGFGAFMDFFLCNLGMRQYYPQDKNV